MTWKTILAAAIAVLCIGQAREKLYRTEIRTMAETRWISNSSTDFADGANWSNGIPASVADDNPGPAIFDGTGQASCTTNVDRSGAAFDKFRLITMEAYTGDIGASGNPLVWDGAGTSPMNTLRGTGTAYLQDTGGGSFIVDSSNFANAVTFEAGNLSVELMIKSGAVTIGESCNALGGCSVFENGELTIEAAAASQNKPTVFNVHGGTVTDARDFDGDEHLVITGGRYTYTGPNLPAGAILVVAGGEMIMTPSAEITTGIVKFDFGTVDLSTSAYPVNFFAMTRGPQAVLVQAIGETTASSYDLNGTLIYP